MFDYRSSYYVPNLNTEARSYLYYVKIVYSKLSFTVVLLLSIVFIISYNNSSVLNKYVNNLVYIISRPCMYIIDAINKNTETVFETMQNIVFLKRENTALKEENKKLKKRTIVIHNLIYENKNLKDIVNYMNVNHTNDFITTKYNFITKGRYANKIRLNIGTENGVSDGNLVMDSDNNLMGRLVRVQDNISEVMLITDIDSRIEAVTYTNRIKLILGGTNGDLLRILYVDNNDHKIIDGDKIFFINNNDVLDGELYIGTVVKIEDKFMVRVDKSFDYIDYLVIIKNSSF